MRLTFSISQGAHLIHEIIFPHFSANFLLLVQQICIDRNPEGKNASDELIIFTFNQTFSLTSSGIGAASIISRVEELFLILSNCVGLGGVL